jgi:hypothetical protein
VAQARPHGQARHSFFAVVLGAAFGGSALQSGARPHRGSTPTSSTTFAGAVAPRSSYTPTMPALTMPCPMPA